MEETLFTVAMLTVVLYTAYIGAKWKLPYFVIGLMSALAFLPAFGVVMLLKTYGSLTYGSFIVLFVMITIIGVNAYRSAQKKKINLGTANKVTGKLLIPLQEKKYLPFGRDEMRANALQSISNLTMVEASDMAEKLARGDFHFGLEICVSEKKARKVCTQAGIKLLPDVLSIEEYEKQVEERKAREQAELERQRAERERQQREEREQREQQQREEREQQLKEAQERHTKAQAIKYKVPYTTIENAREILGVLSTTPMTAKEISAKLGKEFSRFEFNTAIDYLERAAPILQSMKNEKAVGMNGNLYQHSKTAYALYENVKGVIFTYIDTNLKGSITIDDIDGMDGAEFEKCIAKLFERMGYKTEVTKHSGDQGIDVIARKGYTSIGIQAKRHKGKVGNGAVQEVVAGKDFYKVDKVMVITNSEFTPAAIALAQANDVELWNRNILKDKVYQY